MKNITTLSRETRLKMADIASKKNRKGLTGLSEMTIRRLIAKGEFPAPKRYPAMPRSTFFIYGKILAPRERRKVILHTLQPEVRP